MLCVGGGLSTVLGCGSGRLSVLDLGCCGVAPGDDGWVTAERWWHPRERFGWRLRCRLS